MAERPQKPIRDVALAILGRREYGVAELRKKLVNKGFSKEETLPVLEKLVELNMVNDARYAAARARYRAEVCKWGAQKIAGELSQAGIEKALVAAALAGLVDEGIEMPEQAKKLALQKFGRKTTKGAHVSLRRAAVSVNDATVPIGGALWRREKRQEAMKTKNKQIAFMVRRGFSFAEAKTAVEEALAAAEAED